MRKFDDQLRIFVSAALAAACLAGCSMGEEIRRIEEDKRAQEATEQARSTNLTGEQVFIRSCNTCHPSGKQGMGPSLINLDKDFPTDDGLKQMIRKGKGMMPPQPKNVVNDDELKNLVGYLRQLNQNLKSDK